MQGNNSPRNVKRFNYGATALSLQRPAFNREIHSASLHFYSARIHCLDGRSLSRNSLYLNLKSVEEQVHHRRGEESHGLGDDQASDDRNTEWTPQFTSRPSPC